MKPERRRELVAGLEEIVTALGIGGEDVSMFFEEEGERRGDGGASDAPAGGDR
jgi:hypothetical protein